LPQVWQHTVGGEGEDEGLLFDCRFDTNPTLWPVQALFRRVG